MPGSCCVTWCFVLNDNAHRFYERLGFVVIEDVGAYKHMEYWNQARGGGARQLRPSIRILLTAPCRLLPFFL